MEDLLHQNQERVRAIARARGLCLNPDEVRVAKVVGRMAANREAVGAWVCPCKQGGERPDPQRDVCCPCPELDSEVASLGHCHCRLFYAAPGAAR